MEFGLIGERLGHSFSPLIHGMLGEHGYELREIAPPELAGFMRGREFRGVNVTMPYKRDVLPLLDELSDDARAVGAVNTVVNRGGRLCGYNTDLEGMLALLRHMDADLRGKKILILGTGGTGRTAAAAAKRLGAAEGIAVSRGGRENAVSYEDAARLQGDASFIINTTPCGMYPDIGASPMDTGAFLQLEGVADAVFNPLRTRLVTDARGRGVPAEGGLYMLVAQAVRSSELFTGKSRAAGTVDSVYGELLTSLENVVLIGMPGSGKSAVGREAAAILGREFIDLDADVVSAAGMEIKDIFAAKGEAHFRELEAEAVRRAAARTGAVIATGGGAVLAAENVKYLKMNGRLIFLDRPPEELVPTAGRPLADSADKLRRLYSERYEAYRAAADETVVPSGSAEETAKRVVRRFTGREDI